MKQFFYILISLLVLFGLYKLLSSQPGTQGVPESSADLVFYWGDGCPHCEVTKKYIKDNNLEQKVKITYKEVYYNKTNQQALEAVAKTCPNIDSSQGVGIPLAYIPSTKSCLSGSVEIESWLSKK